MNRTRNLTEHEVVRASVLLDEGYCQSYVANLLGKHRSTISRMVRRLNEVGTYSRRLGQGRKRCTSDLDERFIRQYALRNRTVTSSIIRNELQAVRNVTISSKTVRRRLNEAGLNSRRLATAPLLTRANRVARSRFARKHENWSVDDWKQVFFTDETRVSLKHPDGRERVWRRPGERFAPCNISARIPFGGGSVMFWGGICFDARTELVPVRTRSMNADYYLENIVIEHVMPFGHFVGPNFLFMQDNARPHVAREVLDYLNQVDIPIMQWPPKSPDLNPIEHVWDHLKKNVKRHIPAPRNLRELENAVITEWEQIPQDFIQNLIRSMPRRINAVIRSRGGNTRY